MTRPWYQYLPGLALLFSVGYAGKWLEPVLTKSTGVKIEYVLLAILLGMLIRNAIGVHRVFEPGLETYELWLKAGIALMGARFILSDLAKLGGVSLALVFLEIVVAIGIMLVLGRLFKLGDKLTSLLAVGSSVCGVSAIIATRGAIRANNRDTAFAISAILALGALGLFLYPSIAQMVGLSDHGFGLWAGLAIDNTAEAVAAGAMYSDRAGQVAALAKTARNATLGFAVLGFALWYARRGLAAGVEHKGRFIWDKFPKFILAFLGFSVLATIGIFTKGDLTSLKNLYQWFFLLTFAGVGLQIDLKEFRQLGLRPFLVGAVAETAVATATFFMVLVADKLVGLPG